MSEEAPREDGRSRHHQVRQLGEMLNEAHEKLDARAAEIAALKHDIEHALNNLVSECEDRIKAEEKLNEMLAAYDNSAMLALTYHGQRDRAMNALQEIADMEGAEDMTDYKFVERALGIANAILEAEVEPQDDPA